MNIKEVSKQTNIPADTLRYYERIGLITDVPRRESGIRNYDEHCLRWLHLIQNLKKMGFSLNMILEYFDLARLGRQSAEARKSLLQESYRALLQEQKELYERISLVKYQLENYSAVLLPETEALINKNTLHC